jgi:DNA-binding transcriptional LysR family regulator
MAISGLLNMIIASNGNLVSLRHLRYFLAVTETSSFTGAARRLGLSQPTISVQMRQLENYLGTSLFRRCGKRLSLTPAGLIFQERAAVVISQLDNLFQRLPKKPEPSEVFSRR